MRLIKKSVVVLGLTLSLLTSIFAQMITVNSSAGSATKGSKDNTFSYTTSSTSTLLTNSIFSLPSPLQLGPTKSTNAIDTLRLTLTNTVTNMVTSLFTYNSSSSLSSLFSGQIAQGSYTFTTSGTTQNTSRSFRVNLNATAVTPVPEPETYVLIIVGLLGLLIARQRRS